MTVLLIACGTSTLKSPLLRAFFTPHVHSRLRKHLSRCTLDCGFKTSESPALRGFVAERGPVRGTSLYLVLKSNGLRHLKNLPVKFGFSLKTVPTNIAKKLPPQRCPKPFLIPFFNFLRKRPTFAFVGESGHTLGSRRKIAHSGSYAETGAFPPSATASSPKEQPEEADARLWRVSASSGVAAPLGCVIFFASAEVAACTPCAQCFPNVRDEGWYHYPRRALRAAETPDGRLSKRLICRFLASPIYICERPCRIEKDRLRFR